MKKVYWIIIVILLSIIALYIYSYYHDTLGNEYFSDLLGVKDADVNYVCLDQELDSFGEGRTVEEYRLSDEAFRKFEVNFFKGEITPSINKYFSKYDSLTGWKKTPQEFNFNSRFGFESTVRRNEKCLTVDELNRLLSEKGNYYNIYYNVYDYFIFFIISSKTKSIYVIQNNW